MEDFREDPELQGLDKEDFLIERGDVKTIITAYLTPEGVVAFLAIVTLPKEGEKLDDDLEGREFRRLMEEAIQREDYVLAAKYRDMLSLL